MAHNVQEFMRENYKRYSISIPIEKLDSVKAIADEMGMSIQRLFIYSVEKQFGLDLTKPSVAIKEATLQKERSEQLGK